MVACSSMRSEGVADSDHSSEAIMHRPVEEIEILLVPFPVTSHFADGQLSSTSFNICLPISFLLYSLLVLICLTSEF